MNRISVTAIILSFLLVFSSFSFAQTPTSTPCPTTTIHYVSLTGNNGAYGTICDPWRTITYAINTADPYDTIMVSEGIYKYSGDPPQSETFPLAPKDCITYHFRGTKFGINPLITNLEVKVSIGRHMGTEIITMIKLGHTMLYVEPISKTCCK